MVSYYIKFNHNSYCQLQKLEWKQCKISANIAKIIPNCCTLWQKRGPEWKWMLRMLITVLTASLSMPSLRLSSVKGFHKSSDSSTTEEEALWQLRTALQLQSKHRCDPWERKSLYKNAWSGKLALLYFPILSYSTAWKRWQDCLLLNNMESQNCLGSNGPWRSSNSNPLPWAKLPPTRSGCSWTHPTQPWAPHEIEHQQLLCVRGLSN